MSVSKNIFSGCVKAASTEELEKIVLQLKEERLRLLAGVVLRPHFASNYPDLLKISA